MSTRLHKRVWAPGSAIMALFCLIALLNAATLAKQDDTPRDPRQRLFLEVLTEQMTCSAVGGPGIYAFNDPLLLDVESRLGGWRLRMKLTPLSNGEGDEITPEMIELRVDDEWVPMAEPLTAARGARPIHDEMPFAFRLNNTDHLAPGDYHGELLVGLEHPSGRCVPIQRVSVVITVGAAVLHRYTGNKIYMHYGMATEPKTATLRGYVDSDVPLWLMLSVEDGSVGELPIQRAMSSRAPQDAALPLEWMLRERGHRSTRPPDRGDYDEDGILWRLRATPGETEYELDCTAKPQSPQPPGDYGQRFTLTVVPEL